MSKGIVLLYWFDWFILFASMQFIFNISYAIYTEVIAFQVICMDLTLWVGTSLEVTMNIYIYIYIYMCVCVYVYVYVYVYVCVYVYVYVYKYMYMYIQDVWWFEKKNDRKDTCKHSALRSYWVTWFLDGVNFRPAVTANQEQVKRINTSSSIQTVIHKFSTCD